MDKPTKSRKYLIAELRKKYLSVLNEPVPPKLAELVGKLREIERAQKSDDPDAQDR